MGSGTSSYFGYEYQFYVSVWLMLLSHKQHNSNFANMSIETLFGQDAVLALESPALDDSIEGTLSLVQEIGKHSIQVQVKTRKRTKQWSPGDIRDVLLKQDESRPNGLTVLERLAKHPNEIFVFITNGVVSTTLTRLLNDIPRVIQFNEFRQTFSDEITIEIKKDLVGQESDPDSKELLESLLTPDVISRIHIFEAPDIDDLKLKIETILEREYRILPYTRAQQVSRQLLERVRNAALGNEREINAEELTSIIGDVFPNLPYVNIETIFLETSAYSGAASLLKNKHLIVLVGEPGVGKTTIGQKLINEYYCNGYDWNYLTEGSYREVYKACREPDNLVLLMDDPFGDSVFNGNTALTNGFSDIATHLQRANGNVKLILTTRRNVLSEVVKKTRLKTHSLLEYRVDIPEPSINLQKEVLTVFLSHFQCSPDKASAILSDIDWQQSPFEDLLHIHDFAQIVRATPELDKEEIQGALESSRPSEYQRWVSLQPPQVRLILVVLWLLTEVEDAVETTKLKRIYENITNRPGIIGIFGHDSSGYHFYSALDEVLTQERLISSPVRGYSFVHPKLKVAVRKYFEQRPEFVDFSSALIHSFLHIFHPTEQSISAFLTTVYYDRLGSPFELLQGICVSRFLQARDTVVRLGAYLLNHPEKDIRQYIEDFYSSRYTPEYNCRIDEAGHLIVFDGDFTEFRPAEHLATELGLPGEIEKYTTLSNRVLSGDISLFDLNAIEKYWFVRWLTQLYRPAENANDLVHFLGKLALDHTSFVRYTVATQIGKPDLIEMEELKPIFKTLCYDSSPHVKIDLLEHAIMPNWANLPEARQQELLTFVVDMLDDPVFKRRVARGLVDQSGSLYFYHENHTEEQKQQWFEAVAFKLLENEFRFPDDFDRFLAAFDKRIESLSTKFRLSFLQATTRFIDGNPSHAPDLTYTIKRLVFSDITSPEERDLILTLMNRLPSYARAELLFDFAKAYNTLPDIRYREFVHRPFYTESSHEFVLEQTASLLGFLDNPDTSLDDLPKPISNHAHDFQSAIGRFVENQSEDFKLILLFHVFGHQWFTQTSARSSNLHSHPIIKRVIETFLQTNPGSKENILTTDVLLRSGYSNAYWGNEETKMSKESWFEYLETILSTKNSVQGKAICDILFASNITSAVHTYHDWLIILRRLITHPNQEIQTYALILFNVHFHHIWEDLLQHGDEQVVNAWFSGNALKDFSEQSKLFNIALKLLSNIQGWESLSEYQQQENLESIYELAILPDFHFKWLVFNFVEDMGDRLSDSQSERLYRAIFENADNRRETNIPRRDEQLEKDFSLRDRLPEFDWSKYI